MGRADIFIDGRYLARNMLGFWKLKLRVSGNGFEDYLSFLFSEFNVKLVEDIESS